MHIPRTHRINRFTAWAGLLLAACSLSTAPTAMGADWKLTNATRDEAKPGPDGAPSLKVSPGGTAQLTLGDANTSGKVKLAVWDDGTVGIPGKERGVGPRWGITTANDRVLVAGIMYAPYLPEGGGITINDVNPTDGWLSNIKYFSGRKKEAAWQTWEFDFNPENGLTMKVDGKVVPPNRFVWKESKIEGMNGVVIYGDDSKSATPHDFWVATLEAETGPPMVAKPTGPVPPKPVVPEVDPAPEGKVWQMKEEFQNKHPRLMVSEATLPQLREFYNSEAGAPWKKRLEGYVGPSAPPKETKFLTDATDGQRQGFWRLPTVALHYLLTGDPKSLENTKGFLEIFLALPHWETTKEKDSGMSSANVMIGAALAYDWVYNELDPEFRDKFREKLLYQARAQYHGGHLKGNPGPHYWQADPANNHRWHRNAGMSLALLAIYEGRPEEQWLMGKTMEELDFIVKWLPHDGSCHEGPNYFVFGGNHLSVALDAVDQVMGTEYLKAPYFQNAGLYRLHTLLPGMQGIFSHGDGSIESVGGYNNFTLLAASANQQPDVLDGLLRLEEKNPKAYEFGWFSLLWVDPTLKRGKLENISTKALFDDVGFAIMRDSWEDNAVGASFKCGPFGGYDLVKYTEGGKNYINVAHDDPDALEFLITRGKDVVITTDGYSKRKASQNHNTILINGMGQMVGGRPEGGVWSQPAGDMTKMAYITGWKPGDKITAVEGEASGSYQPTSKKQGGTRPAMDRVRRSFLWVEGDYVLALDDIRAPEEVHISWLIQGKELTEGGQGNYVLKSGESQVPMQLVSDKEFTTEIRESPSDHRGESLGLRQLKADVKTSALRTASVYDAWNRGDVKVKLEPTGPDAATVTVTGKDFEDVWTWTSAKDNESPSTLSVERKKGPATGFPYKFGEEDKRIPWLAAKTE